jgi:hypothetical protein
MSTTKLTGRENLTKYAFWLVPIGPTEKENQVKMYKKNSRIWIHIKLKSRIRIWIGIKVKSRIGIKVKSRIWIRLKGSGSATLPPKALKRK